MISFEQSNNTNIPSIDIRGPRVDSQGSCIKSKVWVGFSFFPLSVSIRPVVAGGGRGAYRVEAIDMFRGLTMFICVVVNNRGGYFDIAVDNLPAGSMLRTILLGYRHVPWNGIYFSDIVLPFFHTAMGCGVFLNYGKKTPHLNQCPVVDECSDVPLSDQKADEIAFLKDRNKREQS